MWLGLYLADHSWASASLTWSKSRACARPCNQSISGCTCQALLPVLHASACLGVLVPLDVIGNVDADGELVRVGIPAARARGLKSPAECNTATSVSLVLARSCIVGASELYWQMCYLPPLCIACAVLQTGQRQFWQPPRPQRSLESQSRGRALGRETATCVDS